MTEYDNDQTEAEALTYARGCFQRNLLWGNERLSLSTLKGKARSYGRLYARSRDNLLARLKAAGFKVGERRGPKGLRILTIARS